ncbi:hypothetical protein MPTK1_5g10530 [Marchantia polymorpha subsp. ruderalis]|uniref:Uncharacterized protein n=2 Tax=Marchantia polymorpha TaxID=3197 RepID=A0AAF6BGZ6_MARPO|nr:hypothetical protein MARPO_0048s0019 [Marchantia polymorpha]BBN11280.1 hypothetical protein Mp_5g10530 [Marchantia polymorpha subsp. ruderalis]|eukprot:PTQ38891.1 hypothetical protein MARPO_0048s0019 [Marchantia polymorpha]
MYAPEENLTASAGDWVSGRSFGLRLQRLLCRVSEGSSDRTSSGARAALDILRTLVIRKVLACKSRRSLSNSSRFPRFACRSVHRAVTGRRRRRQRRRPTARRRSDCCALPSTAGGKGRRDGGRRRRRTEGREAGLRISGGEAGTRAFSLRQPRAEEERAPVPRATDERSAKERERGREGARERAIERASAGARPGEECESVCRSRAAADDEEGAREGEQEEKREVCSGRRGEEREGEEKGREESKKRRGGEGRRGGRCLGARLVGCWLGVTGVREGLLGLSFKRERGREGEKEREGQQGGGRKVVRLVERAATECDRAAQEQGSREDSEVWQNDYCGSCERTVAFGTTASEEMTLK